MAMRHVLGLVSLAACLALAGCGGFRAPIMGGPESAIATPANPQMGKVVNGAYFVAPGDTLASISERTNTPIRALIDNNNLQPPYNLRPGQELQVAARQSYTVQSGDTLSGIAARFRVSQSALVDLNNLKSPFILQVGQNLTMPSSLDAPQQPIVASPAGDVAASALPPVSGSAGAPTQISPTPTPVPVAGAAPVTPAAAGTAEPDLTAAEEAAERAYEEAQKKQQQQQQQQAAVRVVPSVPAAPATPTAPVVAAPVSAAPVAGPASAAGFSWPVQGKVIAKFGATADGLRNDGINIAAPEGAPVMAAADGTVAYAGNQLRGFGNLILVRHQNGLITAYAHNQSMLVEKGAKVKRGDVIARVGSTGSVDKPQLHFEIRKGEQAVDPMKYLDG